MNGVNMSFSVISDDELRLLREASARVETLVDAVWLVLDDMADGECCSRGAKAELRLAYEPFNDGEAELVLTVDEARAILGETV